MIYQNDEEIVDIFVEETEEHLQEIEQGILAIEANREVIDEEMIHSMFRAAHSIKAGANLLKLKNIEKISHVLENCLQQIRQENIKLESDAVSLFLLGIDKIRELMGKLEFSDLVDISLLVHQLEKLGKIT